MTKKSTWTPSSSPIERKDGTIKKKENSNTKDKGISVTIPAEITEAVIDPVIIAEMIDRKEKIEEVEEKPKDQPDNWLFKATPLAPPDSFQMSLWTTF